MYYKEVLKIKEDDRKVKLEEFCAKYMLDYKKEKHYRIMNRALNAAKKKCNKLVVIDHIDVYQDELNYINSLELPYDYKKIMFTFLVDKKLKQYIDKLKNKKQKKDKKEENKFYFKGGKQRYKYITEIAHVPKVLKINEEVIHELGEKKLVTILHSGLISLDYLNNCTETGGILKPAIKQFEDIGWYSNLYNGISDIRICEDCGIVFKKKSNYQIKCIQCSPYQPIENKIIVCVDCGKEVEVDARNMTKSRCTECQKIINNEKSKMRMRKFRCQ
jgi:hypothetical protein